MPYIGRAPTGTGSVTEIDGDLKITGQLTANDTLFKMIMDTAANLGDNILIEDGGTDGSGTNAGDDICLEKATEAIVNLSSNVSFGSGGILETLSMVCDGRARTVRSGTYTPGNVTGAQTPNLTYADLNGSSIAYTPPSGTTSVVYDFNLMVRRIDSNCEILCKFFIDSDEVTDARRCLGGYVYLSGPDTLRWVIRIGDGTDTGSGRVASWGSAKTLKWQIRNAVATSEGKAHAVRNWDGGGESEQLSIPILTITALS